MPAEQVRIAADRVEWRAVEDEIVAVDLAAQRYLALTGSATALWPLLLAGTSAAGLVSTLRTRFGIDREAAERDVGSFLAELDRLGLLERT